jgi:hypothetical protein
VGNQPGLLNNFRVRSALGWAGSQPGILNAYSQFITYAQLPFAGRPGLANDITYGNPDLRNERAREWEVGTEVGFLGGRAGLEATYYNRLVSDLLFFRPLATSTGFSRQFYPSGSMSNKGIELMLNTTNVERPNFGWTSTVTPRTTRISSRVWLFNFNRPADTQSHCAGQPVSVFYGSYAARNCATGALLLDSLGRYRRSNQTVDLGATAAQRQAISGGTCNDSLNAVIGDPNPAWMGSFLNEITIGKKLRIRGLLDGVFGNKIMNLSTRAQNAGIASNSKETSASCSLRRSAQAAARVQCPHARHLRVLGRGRTFVKLRACPRAALSTSAVRRLFHDGIDLTVSGRNLWSDRLQRLRS